MTTVRVGVFFDGTDNNKFRDDTDEYSYASGATNIAMLYDGYRSGSSGETTYAKFYVSGPGTALILNQISAPGESPSIPSERRML